MSQERTELTDVSDRGSSPYFHGRENELNIFNTILNASIEEKKGTNLIIQGSPGSGKTALIHQCGGIASQKGWDVFKIKADALWDMKEFRESLKKENLLQFKDVTLKGEFKGIGASTNVYWRKKSILKIITSLKKPTLLMLDEAQHLGHQLAPPTKEAERVVTKVLDTIQNTSLKSPVVLLSAGLGTTMDIFQRFGISRTRVNALIELGPLDHPSERNIISDWLIKHAKAKGPINPWIDAITKETYGWAQHIISYVSPAVTQLQKHNGKVTDDGFKNMLHQGRKNKDNDYERRIIGLFSKELTLLSDLLCNTLESKSISYEDIIKTLEKGFDQEKSKELFHLILERGVLNEKRGYFNTPIPSMRKWLISHFSTKKNEIIESLYHGYNKTTEKN